MSGRVVPWAVRVGWALLPITAGPAIAAALHHHVLATAVSATLWATWAAALVATLFAHPVSLTVLRTAAPAAVAVTAAAAGEGHPSAAAATVAVAWALVVAALAFLPETAMVCVNGPAYPNERRFPLAVPGPLLFGPLELAWVLAVGLPSSAILLLAERRWLLGAIASVVAVPGAVVLGRALHGLSRRWVVFVPAGLVLHDPASLVDPVLFPRQIIERLAPAPADSDSLDLTQRAAGLALELVLTEKVPMVRVVPGRRSGDPGASARLLFTPTRAGAVLAEATRRRFPVRLGEPGR